MFFCGVWGVKTKKLNLPCTDIVVIGLVIGVFSVYYNSGWNASDLVKISKRWVGKDGSVFVREFLKETRWIAFVITRTIAGGLVLFLISRVLRVVWNLLTCRRIDRGPPCIALCSLLEKEDTIDEGRTLEAEEKALLEALEESDQEDEDKKEK